MGNKKAIRIIRARSNDVFGGCSVKREFSEFSEIIALLYRSAVDKIEEAAEFSNDYL